MGTVELVRLARVPRAHASPYSSLTAAQWRPAGQGSRNRREFVLCRAVPCASVARARGTAGPCRQPATLDCGPHWTLPAPLRWSTPLTYRAVRSALSR